MNEKIFNLKRKIARAAPTLLCVLCFGVFGANVRAQKIAVLTPDKTALSLRFAAQLKIFPKYKYKVLDDALSEAAFQSASVENPFNLSAADAAMIGEAIGCDFYLLIKAENLRRSSSAHPEYYESYAVVYVVGAHTGKLIFWKLQSFDRTTQAEAEKSLFASAIELSAMIGDKISFANKEPAKPFSSKIEEVPAENSPASLDLRPPLPYKRIKPQYTPLANLYGVAATVDASADIDETGAVTDVEITRWAGFGLDEAVAETVRKMQWRPARRNDRTLPMRVLLRYNFRKIEKPEDANR